VDFFYLISNKKNMVYWRWGEKKRLFAKLRPAGGGRALAQSRGESGLDEEGRAGAKGRKGVSCMQEMKKKKNTCALPPTSPKYIQNESKSPMCESVSVDDVRAARQLSYTLNKSSSSSSFFPELLPK